MGATGVKLTGPARREKAGLAYQLALRRVTYGEIASYLEISRNLVSSLVKEEQERQWEDRDTSELDAEKRRAIATYEEVIRRAWEKLGKIKDSSLNVSGIFNVIISAQKAIDDITGVKATGSGDNSIGQFADTFRLGAETMRQLHIEQKTGMMSSPEAP